jgi:hypothetical protein
MSFYGVNGWEDSYLASPLAKAKAEARREQNDADKRTLEEGPQVSWNLKWPGPRPPKQSYRDPIGWHLSRT